jgi:peroxiredoxin
VVLALETVGKVVVIDSIPIVKKGRYHFRGTESLTPGQYTFIQNNRLLFRFLISRRQKSKLQFSAHIEGGKTTEIKAFRNAENEAYFGMQRFMLDINRTANLSGADVSMIDRYTDSIAHQVPNTLLAIIAGNISKPPLPQNLFLHDRRVLNTSLLPVRIPSLFTHIVPAHPEFVIPQIDSILNLCTDPKVKEWCGKFLLDYFISSDIMGMENAAVYVAKKFINGELYHANQDIINELETYVAFNELSLIGLIAPELSLRDIDERVVSLSQIDADYVVLIFFDEDCPICREEITEIDRLLQHYQSDDVKVYAVYTQDRYDAWRKYVATLNPQWIWVWDHDFSSGFHKLYGVTGTPSVYLLDRNKTIIGRRIDAHVLKQILSYLID